MDDMYHTCRWCKHYKDGCCTNENILKAVIETDTEYEVVDFEAIEIKEPNTFYCKEWE